MYRLVKIIKNLSMTFFVLLSSSIYSDASVGLTSGNVSDILYRVDLNNGNVSNVVNIPGALLNGAALESNSIAYAVGFMSGDIYRINLENGSFSTVSSSGLNLSEIALANSNTAYTLDNPNGTLYRVDLLSGNMTSIATVPNVANGLALNLCLYDPTTAYVQGGTIIYSVDLGTGQVLEAANVNTTVLNSLSLQNNNNAYSVKDSSDVFYQINLVNGTSEEITPAPAVTGLNGVAVASSSTGFFVDRANNNIYQIDLRNGNSSLIANLGAGVQIHGMALQLEISTANVQGNNLNFARYLNRDASLFVIPLFALQNDIDAALNIAIITRNAISTFMTETAQISMGRVLYNHMGLK